MINLGLATFFEYPQTLKVSISLQDGAIVRINTKQIHGVEPVAGDRYSLTFRRLKPAFIESNRQLNLLDERQG